MCIMRMFVPFKTSAREQSNHGQNIIREHSYSLPVNQPSYELTSEERNIHPKIMKQQLRENKENIYLKMDLYTAYHELKRNRPNFNHELCEQCELTMCVFY